MDTVLKVVMSLDSSCNLYATDSSDYASLTDLTKYAIVEILEDTSDTILQRFHVITGSSDPLLKLSEEMTLSTDGTYIYYRLIVPTLAKLLNSGTYAAQNKYFITNDKIYFSTENFTEFDASASYIREVTDYVEIWTNKDANYLYWFNTKLFSICKLNNCITKKITQWICAKKEDICLTSRDSEIDFLLDSSFALTYLIEQNRFDDAQRVLKLVTSCSNLCEDTTSTCNCNCS